MRLQAGAPAPDFTLQNWDGGDVSLASFRGRMVWLCFHRYASCPLCNLNISKMIEAYPTLKRRLVVLPIFQSPPKSVARYVGRQTPPFPLLCDPDEKVYALYGVESSIAGYVHPKNMPAFAEATVRGHMPGWMEGTKTRLPADFLIDESGCIRLAHYSSVMSEHLSIQVVQEFLAAPTEKAG